MPVTETERQAGYTAQLNYWRHLFNEDAPAHLQKQRVSLLDETTPLLPVAKDMIAAPPGATVRILDLGAGPISRLNPLWPHRTVEITALDALAPQYNQLLTEKNITPRLRTQAGTAETLPEQFAPNTFDLVHTVNHLDTYDAPLQALKNALAVLKPYAWLVSIDYANEGQMHNYSGHHQWNFNHENGRFILWNPDQRIDVMEALGAGARLFQHKVPVNLPKHGPQHWLHTYLQKTGRSQ